MSARSALFLKEGCEGSRKNQKRTDELGVQSVDALHDNNAAMVGQVHFLLFAVEALVD